MNSSPPLRLSPDDKLDLLRYLDEFRFWHSLDDRRRCRRCHEEITGQQILIREPRGTRGKMRLQCPTPGCPSTPSEWTYADPILAATLKSDFRPRLALVQKEAARSTTTVHDGRKGADKKRPGKRGNTPGAKVSLRAAAARVPILRSLVTGLHAIYPVI